MNNPIGDKIKEIRQRKNLSQTEVAERLSISQSAYAKIEQGAVRLDVERLMALADIFEVEYHELLARLSE
ncbi:MAG: helix-turn-helix transcriptional regulator [Saprospiraceae bacterium]|nr:helix-turn-helix transcriptional regulator [Saprospiraceae bacterium]